MSIFGEVMNPGRGQGSGRSEDAQERHMARLIKVGVTALAVLIAALIFFSYVASITRIGAGGRRF